MATVLKHFKHYYYNFGITLSISNIYFAFEKDADPLRIAIMFGRVLGTLNSMKAPTTFINLHRNLPKFTELPAELQQVLKSMEEPYYALFEYIDDNLEKEFAALLKERKDKEARDLLKKLNTLADRFFDKIAPYLKDFKQEYPE